MTDEQEQAQTLEDALDGLLTASRYCEAAGLDDLSKRAADLYQDVGAESPEEDWND